MLFEIGRKKAEGNTGKTLVVNRARCPQNHRCPALAVCPNNALTQKGFAAPEVNDETCIRCAKCVRTCPMGALALR